MTESDPATDFGTLYMCGTPIGNLQDVTLRLLEILRDVDLVACEDTRRTMKLLSNFDLRKPVLSLYRHVEKGRAERILDMLEEGKSVAYVSDAGMPTISDPGAYLVQAARERGIRVALVPGPSSVSGALALSGFPADRFVFGGFPPRKPRKRKEFFKEWILPGVTAVFFESPHRLKESLTDMEEVFPDIEVCLCHEMTKVHESCIRGDIQDANRQIADLKLLGEWVMVVRLTG